MFPATIIKPAADPTFEFANAPGPASLLLLAIDFGDGVGGMAPSSQGAAAPVTTRARKTATMA
eukprot:CAMPEP_0172717188 /NCGR_PEP_ID=MMETSP1074-20121228/70628_1 /TAXON_ID=2916 /ORGANISM="Ceratium fusus, Strain PA161109" /LENGTH=62 /DNA_ID=CAMNT_0013542067 /DNA_START=419 /DNA_END=604 /DNA_ORIENTATION=-